MTTIIGLTPPIPVRQFVSSAAAGTSWNPGAPSWISPNATNPTAKRLIPIPVTIWVPFQYVLITAKISPNSAPLPNPLSRPTIGPPASAPRAPTKALSKRIPSRPMLNSPEVSVTISPTAVSVIGTMAWRE